MPIIFRHISAIALAAILLCGGRVLTDFAWTAPVERPTKPQVRSDALAIDVKPLDAKPFRSRCRIYFGCPPVIRVAAVATLQQ